MEGLAASQITLEVTGRTIVDDVLARVGTLTRLRSRGIALPVDDFGTGYSSLEPLYEPMPGADLLGRIEDCTTHK